MGWCLTKQAESDLMKALREDGDPQKMVDRGSEGRYKWFAKYVGEANAKDLNTLFESKMLLKSQVKGFQSFIKNMGGSKKVQMDFLSKVERLNTALSKSEVKQWLGDYVSKRLGLGISEEEYKNIDDLSNKISELKTKANKEGTFPTEKERLDYGLSKVALEKYVNDLKLESRKPTGIGKITNVVKEVPGVLKSLVASMDNSFWGRQGIKTLLDVRTSNIWFKNFLKSWVDIGRELKGKDAMDLIRADIYSRPNALNGKYEAGRYGLDVLSEEAYPSSLPGKIPLFKRLYKASESAYNGGALRMRADLADRLIKIAEKQGVNTLDPKQAQGMGSLISSLTGRGSIGKLEPAGKELNVLLFSIKFLKGNIDTLTAHQFDPKATPFTKKEAAKNLLSIIASIASILTIAKLLDPDSVDEDPRSTNFGKVKIFGHWVDITGGMASLVTLATRLIPTKHNGKRGFWTKSSTGNYTNLIEGKYGQQTALDVFENFWEGKLSPIAGIVRDVWKGKDFQGRPVTPENIVKGVTTPISIQNFQQLKEDPQSSSILGSMILEELGLSTSTYVYKKDWTQSTSKEMLQFKKKVGNTKFLQASDDFNRSYNLWFNDISQKDSYKKLSDDNKTKLNDNAKEKLKQKIFKKYHFKYRQTIEDKRSKVIQKRSIKKLLPK